MKNKNDAELYLNDLPLSQLPKEFQKLIRQHNYNGRKYGRYIREHHRSAFDLWFSESSAQASIPKQEPIPDNHLCPVS